MCELKSTGLILNGRALKAIPRWRHFRC